MSGPFGRFDPSELRTPGETDPSVAELADALAAARELEALAGGDGIRPTDGFEDRVMAAIALEPPPRVVVRAGSAVRGGVPAAFLLAVRDAWRVGTTGGRPLAVRAQALAFVLIVALGAGALTTATAITVGGFLQGDEGPPPSVEPGPSVAPVPSASPTMTQTANPSGSPEPTETAEPTETPTPGVTAPTQTPSAAETPRPTRTPRPTETPKPGETPRPTETPEPSDDHGGPGPG